MPKFLNASSEKRKRQRRKHENELRFKCLDSKQENSARTKTCNAQPKVVVNSQSKYDIPITHVNSMEVCSPKNCSTIETSNFQSTPVVKSEPLEYNDGIYLTQLNSKVDQLTYDQDQDQEFLYIKSEEIAEDNNPEVTYNFMLYEINARNPVVLNVNQLNTESDKYTKNHAFEIANFSEGTSKCACHLNPMKNVDVHSNLELKDFFERMFEETCKLKLEDRQTIKTELLKAVSQAEEDVEAGKFCEKCYTMLAQPKKRC